MLLTALCFSSDAQGEPPDTAPRPSAPAVEIVLPSVERDAAVTLPGVPTAWPTDVPDKLRPEAFSEAVLTALASSKAWHVDFIDCSEYPCVFAISSDDDQEAPPLAAIGAVWEPRFEVYGGAGFMVLSPRVSGLPPEASERLQARRKAITKLRP